MATYSRHTRKKETFWALILGIAIIGLVIWGIFEIVDDDPADIGFGSGEVGWVNERAPNEVPLAPNHDGVKPVNERAARDVVPPR